MKKLFLMMMVMTMGAGAFAAEKFIGVGKTDAEYEAAIKNSTHPYIKSMTELYYAGLKDKSLTENFDAFLKKAQEICEKNKLTINYKTSAFMPATISLLKADKLYADMIKYANCENYYVNTIYPKYNVWKIQDKDTLMKVLNFDVSDKQVYNNLYLSQCTYDILEKYQDMLTSEETVAILKKFKRNTYKNIAISEDWKKLMIKVELMIKANE